LELKLGITAARFKLDAADRDADEPPGRGRDLLWFQERSDASSRLEHARARALR